MRAFTAMRMIRLPRGYVRAWLSISINLSVAAVLAYLRVKSLTLATAPGRRNPRIITTSDRRQLHLRRHRDSSIRQYPLKKRDRSLLRLITNSIELFQRRGVRQTIAPRPNRGGPNRSSRQTKEVVFWVLHHIVIDRRAFLVCLFLAAWTVGTSVGRVAVTLIIRVIA